jgi:hypothetical protein
MHDRVPVVLASESFVVARALKATLLDSGSICAKLGEVAARDVDRGRSSDWRGRGLSSQSNDEELDSGCETHLGGVC